MRLRSREQHKPFSITVLLRVMYQVLGYLVLSVGVAVGQVASIVVAVFVFTQVAAPDIYNNFNRKICHDN